ncbi:peptidase family M48-domain-containing protein [Mycotypha africana]|uniref:peptidase family M48-domain-containing protein n=1 Tax=Mycotypha africana TaxID=64632 RepID=UPI002300E7F3|nr:peptidase family M48-domain-containing protein [Mycotypha africana]KAI8977148.1 peptidase family M48-domain-containing protein [Mycotypha africana]
MILRFLRSNFGGPICLDCYRAIHKTDSNGRSGRKIKKIFTIVDQYSSRVAQKQCPRLLPLYTRQHPVTNLQQQRNTHIRLFHTTKPVAAPIVPIPAIILGALKTGKLVSFVSLSSKTSLTLLPHTFRRGNKSETIARILAGIPLFGFTLLLVIGLDQAPNTSRLRLIYLSEEEEEAIVNAEIDELLQTQSGLVAPKDNEVVMWLQTIVDNLAASAVDDIRDPVRLYEANDVPLLHQHQIQQEPFASLTTPSSPSDVVLTAPTRGDIEKEGEVSRPVIHPRRFEVDVICDSSTVNAMCAGSRIVVYNLLLDYMEYDSTRLAVILSHEIAHSIQRHFVEQHGFASLMLMLGDITRGVFWIMTESLGPYVNQKINECISTFVTLETQTIYNRKLEKEADLVGLKILAKAGYDPRVAIDVWQRMAELDSEIQAAVTSGNEGSQKNARRRAITTINSSANSSSPSTAPPTYEDLEFGVREFLDSLVSSWFGSSHPPSLERIEYMRENMDEAVRIYNETLEINGPAKDFIFSEDLQKQQSEAWLLNRINATEWVSVVMNWLSSVSVWFVSSSTHSTV